MPCHCHGGSCLHWCAGGGVCDVTNNSGGSLSWLIAVTEQLTSTRLVVWKSVGNTHSIACSLCDSWAYCNNACRNRKLLVVEQNVAVAESAPEADVQSVCIIYTTADNISTDTECCACLSVIAELLACSWQQTAPPSCRILILIKPLLLVCDCLFISESSCLFHS